MSLMQKIGLKEYLSPIFINIDSTVSAKGMRIIDKKGIDEVISEIRKRGEKI